jgi:hypothetical protein
MAMPKVLVLFLLGVCSARCCLAQPVPFGDIPEEEGVPNYAYSVFAGTGVYKIDDRRIYILRVPMKFDLKKIDYEAGEKYGLRLLLPVSVGITDFEDAEGCLILAWMTCTHSAQRLGLKCPSLSVPGGR